MAAERKLFIDIDREPERSRSRPAAMPGSGPGGASPLWPAQAAPRSKGDLGQASTSPVGIVPLAAPPAGGRAGDLFAQATQRLPPDLAASLAALKADLSRGQTLSLADALASMRAPAASPAPGALQPAPPPDAAAPAPGVDPPSVAAEATPGWRSPDGIYHIRVADAAPLPLASAVCAEEPANDEYLARSYDFTRPAVADLYDRTVVPLWSAPFGRMLLSVFQGCPRQPGWQVVDVACGTGYPTLELANLLGPDGDVAGVDVWGVGVARARAKAADQQVNNVAFLVADVADCALPERAFDMAVCNLGLTNFARPEAALKGVARLLQPNGTLILTTNLQGTMQEFFETYRGVLNDLGLIDLSWDVERVMHTQPTMERVEALLDMAGFTVDQTLSDHFALEFPNGGAFLRSPMVGMGFLHSWRKVVGDLALRKVVFNEIERRLNTRAAAWGRLDLIVPMLCVTARRRTQE